MTSTQLKQQKYDKVAKEAQTISGQQFLAYVLFIISLIPTLICVGDFVVNLTLGKHLELQSAFWMISWLLFSVGLSLMCLIRIKITKQRMHEFKKRCQ